MRMKATKRRLVFLAAVVVVCGLVWWFTPAYVTSPREARERILRQDLLTMRSIISQYTLDKQKRPRSLDDLVVAGYFKEVPIDPTTKRNDTWILECSKDPKAPGIIAIGATSGGIGRTRTFHCD
jgi:hypothetical protein